jgi:CheY-like chemotaxis protein
MAKKILLIENDSALAGSLAESLEAAGYDVRAAVEGKSGLDLAREWSPDAIVLCVELPGMSGYLVCQKLRKDEATKAIPLVLVSAEATEDTFEKHRALKVRADAYLLKPFAPDALLEKLSEAGLSGQLDEAPATTDELSLEPADGLELDPGAAMPSLELDTLPDEPPASAAQAVDDDLAFLDEAFDGLAAPAAPASERSDADEELSTAAASIPDEEEPAPAAAVGLVEEDDPLAELRGDPAPPPPVRAPSADVLRAAGIPLLDEPPARPASRPTLAGVSSTTSKMAPMPGLPRPGGDVGASDRLQRDLAEARTALAARDADLRQLRVRAEEAAQRAEAAESAAAEREAELASVRARLDAISGQARKSEGELKAAREEARRATSELEGLRSKLADADRRLSENASAADRIDELERELESARTEIIVAQGEAEGARGEVDARASELAKRVAELEAQSAKNEERVFKAYQKIKGDEKVKDKVRKAIAIAAQLLDEGLPAEPAAAPEKSSKVS